MKLFFGQIFPTIEIHPEEQQHISRVLRMKEGETLFLTDGKGNRLEGHLRYEGKKVSLEVTRRFEKVEAPQNSLHIAIAPTKNLDRIEFFIEKATELGVAELSFLLTDHSERKNLNTDRVEKQVLAASKQSLRVHFPKVNGLMKLSELLEKVDSSNTFVAHCDPSLPRMEISSLEPKGAVTVLIGPEGDFSSREIEMLSNSGIGALSLGSQRLRTETAGVFTAAWHYFKGL